MEVNWIKEVCVLTRIQSTNQLHDYSHANENTR